MTLSNRQERIALYWLARQKGIRHVCQPNAERLLNKWFPGGAERFVELNFGQDVAEVLMVDGLLYEDEQKIFLM